MKKLFLLISLAIVSIQASAQSREYIRNQIERHGECRNVAITEYNGDLMLYGRNGWAATGCPDGLTEALHELNDEEQFINDVQLTNDGSWLIVYGKNGLRWNDIPYSLEQKLRAWNNNNEEITSVTFNDVGDWIAVSTEHIAASSRELQDWVADGMDYYGAVLATCITEDAAVVVYEEGYRFLGEVPQDLKRRLETVSFNVYRVKIAGSAWFISDNKSRYSYNM